MTTKRYFEHALPFFALAAWLATIIGLTISVSAAVPSAGKPPTATPSGPTATASSATATPTASGATLTVPHLIASHMVLQRGMSVPIWGTGAAGATVTVHFNGQNVSGTVAADGTWRVNLVSMSETTSPQTMTINSSDNQTLTFTDVQVGEVWGCSGQSNMEFSLGSSDGGAAAVADAPNHNIRLFEAKGSVTPATAIWAISDATTAGDFSAVCYYFGRELSQRFNVPIGLIQPTVSGTKIEEWSHFSGGSNDGQYYDSKIKPLIPYAIKGFTWYQGEANSTDYTYFDKLQGMIAEWRTAWGQGNFPFGIVQLPMDRPPLPRDEQLEAFLRVPGTFFAVATDLPDLGGTGGHPANKKPIGLRLALSARTLVYGETTEPVGPIRNVATSSISGNKIIVGFTHVGGGLVTGSEWQPGGAPTPFEIAGVDGTFYPATATIVGNTVEVTSASVSNPVWVQYTWNYGPGNLYSLVSIPTEGGAVTYTRLPASSFELMLGSVSHIADMFTADVNGNPQSTFAPGSTLYWRVKVVDRSGAVVPGAVVNSTIVKPNRLTLTSVSATTGADGWALLSLKLQSGATAGTYQVNVSDITKTGTLYERTEDVKTMVLFNVQ